MKPILILAALIGFAGWAHAAENEKKKPNIVLILADDLGTGEVGCYGQKIITTPNIDLLAKQGMKFMQAYSPSPVCAPTRCCLMTGLDTGHAYIRDNQEMKPEGQLPIPDSAMTIAEVLKKGGYATACIGKWGLGMVGTSGDPIRQGFDFFYGDNCQRVAHNHYTDHLWKNDEKVVLAGNVVGNVMGKQYAPDLMADEAIKWLGEQQKDKPFFLYFATTLPHVSLQAPKDAVAAYKGKVGQETPFVPKKGDYVECDEPRATYAAMVTKIDDYVGRIMGKLKEMGVADNTIVIFASDNGPTFNAGTDSKWFGSTEGRKGLKEEVYEGGIWVPMIAWWPGHVKAGTQTEYATELYDLFPTFAQIGQVDINDVKTDGISLVPVIEGKDAKSHDYLYWEIHMKGGRRALRQGDWKIVQNNVKKGGDVELYDLAADPDEKKNLAADKPEKVKEMVKLMQGARTESEVKAWNF
ncbi:MAG TPA: arylsulfatase [Tepidisphaeraceae bacterium]|jgi:arylsulfatase A-like enzyme|nr:arylsulfatase [Tepidisphaeraceae bacterium]